MAFAPQELTVPTLKAFVDRLLVHTKAHPPQRFPEAPIRRAWAQEAVAASLGWPNWHAAITVAQTRTETPAPGATDPWAIPGDMLQGCEIRPKFGALRPEGAGPWRVPVVDLNKHALIWGQESVRRDFIEHVSRLNPERPFLVLQGPASLPLRRWKGTTLTAMSFDAALATETALALTDLVLGPRNSSGGHDPWASRASALFSDVLTAAVWMRDNGHMRLDTAALLEHITLEGVDQLARHPRMPTDMAERLAAYLRSLPGFHSGTPGWSDVIREQHGYLQVQLIAPIQRACQEGWILGGLIRSAGPQTSVDLTNAIGREKENTGAIARAIEAWVHQHPGGLVVLDGLDAESDLWDQLVVRLPHWREAHVGAWIGICVLDDLPKDPVRARLMARVDGQAYLVGANGG